MKGWSACKKGAYALFDGKKRELQLEAKENLDEYQLREDKSGVLHNFTPGQDLNAALSSRTALGRLDTPEDIGNVAVFLSTDEASFVTGQEIEVSGGFK